MRNFFLSLLFFFFFFFRAQQKRTLSPQNSSLGGRQQLPLAACFTNTLLYETCLCSHYPYQRKETGVCCRRDQFQLRLQQVFQHIVCDRVCRPIVMLNFRIVPAGSGCSLRRGRHMEHLTTGQLFLSQLDDCRDKEMNPPAETNKQTTSAWPFSAAAIRGDFLSLSGQLRSQPPSTRHFATEK